MSKGHLLALSNALLLRGAFGSKRKGFEAGLSSRWIKSATKLQLTAVVVLVTASPSSFQTKQVLLHYVQRDLSVCQVRGMCANPSSAGKQGWPQCISTQLLCGPKKNQKVASMYAPFDHPASFSPERTEGCRQSVSGVKFVVVATNSSCTRY